MSALTQRANLGQLIAWEANQNFTREQVVLEGLTGHDFVPGTPLEPGTGTNKKTGAVLANIDSILLSDVGTLATGSTQTVTALVRGPAILNSSYIGPGNSLTAAAVVGQLQGDPTQIPGTVLLHDEPTYS